MGSVWYVLAPPIYRVGSWEDFESQDTPRSYAVLDLCQDFGLELMTMGNMHEICFVVSVVGHQLSLATELGGKEFIRLLLHQRVSIFIYLEY